MAEHGRHIWPGSLLWLAALGIASLVSACGAVAEPVLPTMRPTPTASPIPSDTPTPVFTASPTRIMITVAPTGGPSPTPLLGSVPTQPRRTLTPTQAIGAGNIQIEYFTTSSSSVKPGEKLTLFWSAKGVEKATIFRLDAKGKRGQQWNVARNGSIDVPTKADDRDVVQFLLTVGDENTHLEQTLAVPVTCTEALIFQPESGDCASAPVVTTNEVQQTFERGVMVWVESQSRVYVLFNDSKTPAWTYYPDEFKDGQPDRDPSISPPAGLLQPIRGFGLVWRTRENVRERLGWATGGEKPFAGQIQGDAAADKGVTYLRAQDGDVLALSDKGASWKLITP